MMRQILQYYLRYVTRQITNLAVDLNPYFNISTRTGRKRIQLPISLFEECKKGGCEIQVGY